MSHIEEREHWEQVYRSKAPSAVSWFQPRAGLSFELIRGAIPDRESPIIDVGGGTSMFGDGL